MRLTPLGKLTLGLMAFWLGVGAVTVSMLATTGCAPSGYHWAPAHAGGRTERAYSTPENPGGRAAARVGNVLVKNQALTPAQSRAVSKDLILLGLCAVVPIWVASAAR